MIIYDNIIEWGTLSNVLLSLFLGFLLIMGVLVYIFIKAWEKIKAYAILFIIVMIFIGPFPFLFLWLGVFGFLPIMLNSFIPGGLLEENKLKIENTVIKTNIKVNGVSPHCIIVKKWWDDSGEDFAIDVGKDNFNNYKKGQVVSLNSQKGIFGIRRLIRDDKYLKIISEPEEDTNSSSLLDTSALVSPATKTLENKTSETKPKNTKRRKKKSSNI